MKKNRLPFSALAKDPEPEAREIKVTPRARNSRAKSSTYQYSKKFGGQRSRGFGKKTFNGPKQKEEKIPPLQSGVVRIIPLGGVEEIGKNMTAVEIGEDIIVIDAGMHFASEDTPGVDYVIPNTTYLEERKEK